MATTRLVAKKLMVTTLRVLFALYTAACVCARVRVCARVHERGEEERMSTTDGHQVRINLFYVCQGFWSEAMQNGRRWRGRELLNEMLVEGIERAKQTCWRAYNILSRILSRLVAQRGVLVPSRREYLQGSCVLVIRWNRF